MPEACGPVAGRYAANPISWSLLLTHLLLTSTPKTLLRSLLTSKDVSKRFLRLRETTYLSSLEVVALFRLDPGLFS